MFLFKEKKKYMYIIGLTGSMGSGKSTIALMLKHLGVPVHSADETVHALLKNPLLVQEIKNRWPEVILEGKIDRKALAVQIFSRPEYVSWLEQKLYPLVRELRKKFLTCKARQRCQLVVLDIPLLFEKKMERQCDEVLVVSSSALLQQKRLLKRKGMSLFLMKQILSYQLPLHQKRKRADYILHSGLHRGHLFHQVKTLIRRLFLKNGSKWSPRWKRTPGR